MPLPPCQEPTDSTLSDSMFVLGRGRGQGSTKKSGSPFLPLHCEVMTNFFNLSQAFREELGCECLQVTCFFALEHSAGFSFPLEFSVSVNICDFVLPCPASYSVRPFKLRLGSPASPPSRMDLQPFESRCWVWRDGHRAAPGTPGTWVGLTPHQLV